MGEKVEETVCVARGKLVAEKLETVTKEVSEIHDVIYKNGLVKSIKTTEAMLSANNMLTRANTILIGFLIVFILGLTGYLIREVIELKSTPICNMVNL